MSILLNPANFATRSKILALILITFVESSGFHSTGAVDPSPVQSSQKRTERETLTMWA